MTEYDSLSLIQLWQLVFGVVLPLVIAMVTRVTWRPWAKSLTMLAFVTATTVVGMLIEGRQQPTTLREWTTALFVVFLTSVTTYRHVWKPTGVTGAIERNVNPGSAPDPIMLDQPAADGELVEQQTPAGDDAPVIPERAADDTREVI